MGISPTKRKALYILEEDEEEIWVEQKRPMFKDRDKFRPFWDNFDDAVAAMDRFAAGQRVTFYRINKNKVESYRVRRYEPNVGGYTSRQQAEDRLTVLTETIDYTITRGSISLFFKGESYTITATDSRFPKLRKACLDNDVADIVKLINLKSELKKVVDDKGKLLGNKVPTNLGKKMQEMTLKIGDTKSLEAFKKRLAKNPSKSAQKNLLKFLDYTGGCLVADGRFLAYKYLKPNFHDMHTGKYDYSPGKVVTMPRDKVVEDCRIACAAGLHVGTWGYSGNHETMVLCVIDPYDVVSVPDDYSHQKIRACKVTSVRRIYEPIKELVVPVSFLND